MCILLCHYIDMKGKCSCSVNTHAPMFKSRVLCAFRSAKQCKSEGIDNCSSISLKYMDMHKMDLQIICSLFFFFTLEPQCVIANGSVLLQLCLCTVNTHSYFDACRWDSENNVLEILVRGHQIHDFIEIVRMPVLQVRFL